MLPFIALARERTSYYFLSIQIHQQIYLEFSLLLQFVFLLSITPYLCYTFYESTKIEDTITGEVIPLRKFVDTVTSPVEKKIGEIHSSNVCFCFFSPFVLPLSPLSPSCYTSYYTSQKIRENGLKWICLLLLATVLLLSSAFWLRGAAFMVLFVLLQSQHHLC